MARCEGTQCDAEFSDKAHFCPRCGRPVPTAEARGNDVGGGCAREIGFAVWMACGTVMAVAGAEGEKGLQAGAGFLFIVIVIRYCLRWRNGAQRTVPSIMPPS